MGNGAVGDSIAQNYLNLMFNIPEYVYNSIIRSLPVLPVIQVCLAGKDYIIEHRITLYNSLPQYGRSVEGHYNGRYFFLILIFICF